MNGNLWLSFAGGAALGLYIIGPITSAIVINQIETRRWRKALPYILEYERGLASQRRENEARIRAMKARRQAEGSAKNS